MSNTHLKAGEKAPDFSGEDQEGRPISLADYKGKRLVLYFYPKDNTPGCTAEACDLAENYRKLLDRDFEVLGVSPDSAKSHQNFIDKYELPFNLIADTDREVMEAYGVLKENKKGVNRTTFVISPDGTIEKVIEKVNTKAHADQILEEVEA